MRMKPKLLLFTAISFLFLGSASPIIRAQQPVSSTAKPPASTPEDSQYVGSDTCKTCHEDLYNSWAKTPHWKTMLDKRSSPSHQGCESCHGPGADHVAGGGDKSKIFIFAKASATEVNTRCLTCHVRSHPNLALCASPGQGKLHRLSQPDAFTSAANLLKVSQPQSVTPATPT